MTKKGSRGINHFSLWCKRHPLTLLHFNFVFILMQTSSAEETTSIICVYHWVQSTCLNPLGIFIAIDKNTNIASTSSRKLLENPVLEYSVICRYYSLLLAKIQWRLFVFKGIFKIPIEIRFRNTLYVYTNVSFSVGNKDNSQGSGSLIWCDLIVFCAFACNNNYPEINSVSGP